MKKFLYFVVVFTVCASSVLFVIYQRSISSDNKPKDGSQNEKRIEFINSFGWQVSPTPEEKTLTLVPEMFTKVLNEYNEMQLKSGFDLRPLSGKEITRFSYKLLNHPLDKHYARVNLFVYKGEIVAADVSSTRLDGFMHSIEKNDF